MGIPNAGKMMPTNSEFVDAVTKVHEFYAQSFSDLQNIIFAVVGLVGVLVPVGITFYQNRRFGRENEALRRELEATIAAAAEEKFSGLRATLEQRFAAGDAAIDEKLIEIKADLARRSSDASGSVFHIQGNAEVREKLYGLAALSYLPAIKNYFEAENFQDMRVACNALSAICLPRMDQGDFEREPEIQLGIERTLKRMRKNNDKGVNSDLVRALDSAFRDAQNRAPKVVPSA